MLFSVTGCRPLLRLVLFFLVFVLRSLASAECSTEPVELLSNGGFEKGGNTERPSVGWLEYTPMGSAEYRRVADIKHSGSACALVRTRSDLVANLVSDSATPVAPGEELDLSVWARAQDLTSTSGGRLVFNAGFLDFHGHYFRWQRVQPKLPPEGRWVQLKTAVEVPPDAYYATLQVGVRHMSGSTWWDDASMIALSPLAARIDPPRSSIEPGDSTLTLTLLNRNPRNRNSRIVIEIEPGKGMLEHTLSGAPMTTVTVPVCLTRRGKNVLSVSLRDVTTDAVLFTTSHTVTVPPQLAVEPLTPTHYCIEDHEPRLNGCLEVHEPDPSRRGMSLACELHDPLSRRIIAAWHTPSVPVGPVRFTLSVPEKAAKPGTYLLCTRLLRKEQLVTSVTQEWRVIRRAEAETVMAADGTLRVRGKPFFPIGLYMGRNTPELAEAGFNVNQNYNLFSTPAGEKPKNAPIKEFLDRAEAAGLKALVFTSHGLQSRLGMEDSLDRIRMFRNHPALLVWYEEEAVARGIRPLSWLGELYSLFKRNDRNHPVLIGDERDVSTRITDRSSLFPDEFMDIGIWWWYPIPVRGGRNLEGYEGEPTSSVTQELVPPTFLTQARTKKPIWAAVQCYRKPDAPDARFPTPEELRAQAYIVIVHGAKGVFFYTGAGEQGNGILNKPKDGHWEELKKLATELKDMSPVFLAPDSAEPVKVVPESAPVSVRMKKAGDKRVILAVNRTKLPMDVVFQADTRSEKPVVVRYEDRIVTPSDAGGFRDSFGPYAVHIYELP